MWPWLCLPGAAHLVCIWAVRDTWGGAVCTAFHKDDHC